MASERDLLSTEIVNRGIESSGPSNAGSHTFSVRVRRRLPDFLQSVHPKVCEVGLPPPHKPASVLGHNSCARAGFQC
ncbi:hypothetical protein GBA52_028313 [Prunus armeniaca]|nr:hypothetical protein GBA52_028313 [Prunus armeniaca]